MKNTKNNIEYFIKAYDVPLNMQRIPGHTITHEEEIGEAYNTIQDAITAAHRWRENHKYEIYDNQPFPDHLIYISEWDNEEDELNESKSLIEWEN